MFGLVSWWNCSLEFGIPKYELACGRDQFLVSHPQSVYKAVERPPDEHVQGMHKEFDVKDQADAVTDVDVKLWKHPIATDLLSRIIMLVPVLTEIQISQRLRGRHELDISLWAQYRTIMSSSK